MQTTELELTYLAKTLPADLASYPAKQIISVSFPSNSPHPTLRVRCVGDQYEITRKVMAEGTDSSKMIEQTIELDRDEFAELSAHGGKRVEKMRYYYPYQGLTAEIDVFGGGLEGLVLVDIEFTDRDQQLKFPMPDFCLAEVTQEKFLAGGMVAGKSYADIKDQLAHYNYQPLFLEKAA